MAAAHALEIPEVALAITLCGERPALHAARASCRAICRSYTDALPAAIQAYPTNLYVCGGVPGTGDPCGVECFSTARGRWEAVLRRAAPGFVAAATLDGQVASSIRGVYVI